LAASITRADIARIHAEYGNSHPYGANRFICVVRKMYNVGRQLGMIPEEMRNPGTEIQRFPEHKRRRYVTPAEMPRLAAAINDDPNEFAGHALWLLLLTDIRRNEILAAKWADVDWDNKTLFIGKTKNREPVLTPLSRAGQSLHYLRSDSGQAARLPGCDVAPHSSRNGVSRLENS
jgi:integrase